MGHWQKFLPDSCRDSFETAPCVFHECDYSTLERVRESPCMFRSQARSRETPHIRYNQEKNIITIPKLQIYHHSTFKSTKIVINMLWAVIISFLNVLREVADMKLWTGENEWLFYRDNIMRIKSFGKEYTIGVIYWLNCGSQNRAGVSVLWSDTLFIKTGCSAHKKYCKNVKKNINFQFGKIYKHWGRKLLPYHQIFQAYIFLVPNTPVSEFRLFPACKAGLHSKTGRFGLIFICQFVL